jgi:putative metallohydrolase (TIGR04338 family)
MRRCQQGGMYAAERRVPLGIRFSDEAEAVRYLTRVMDHPMWPLEHPRVERVDVRIDRRHANPCGGWSFEDRVGRINLARSPYEIVLLHELAHIVCHADTGSRQAHGPVFARTYLELVYRNMGSEVYQQLHRGMLDEGLEFHADAPAGRERLVHAMGPADASG